MSVYKYKTSIRGTYDGKHFMPFTHPNSYYLPKEENLTKITNCAQCMGLRPNEEYTWCWTHECPNYSKLGTGGIVYNDNI